MTPTQTEARKQYERLLRKLLTLDHDSSEADAVRDEMDKWWDMTEAERAEMVSLASTLQREP